MNIIPLVVGDLRTNCYLVSDPSTRKTVIIDPADEGDFISTTILENKLVPEKIILTHGHYDHCLATLELKLNFNIPIYLHQADLFLYQNAHKSATFWSHKSVPHHGETIKIPSLPPIDFFLENDQIISFGDSSFQVIHTPGHTPGSICLTSSLRDSYSNRGNLIPNTLFTGDTLFSTGPGRADHSYSSKSDLQQSLQRLQSTMDNLKCEILIYPGHEDFETSIKSNLLLQSN